MFRCLSNRVITVGDLHFFLFTKRSKLYSLIDILYIFTETLTRARVKKINIPNSRTLRGISFHYSNYCLSHMPEEPSEAMVEPVEVVQSANALSFALSGKCRFPISHFSKKINKIGKPWKQEMNLQQITIHSRNRFPMELIRPCLIWFKVET